MTSSVRLVADYRAVQAMVADYLDPRYTDQRRVTYSPGPAGDTGELKLTPQRLLFLEVGGGPGLHLEDSFDRVFIAARIVGPQRDFDGAEQLALDTDYAFCRFCESVTLASGLRVLSVARAGGRPQSLLKDSAERYHFTASYIGDFESGQV